MPAIKLTAAQCRAIAAIVCPETEETTTTLRPIMRLRNLLTSPRFDRDAAIGLLNDIERHVYNAQQGLSKLR